MKYTTQQGFLLDWVKSWHDGQLRKYTNEPYYVHLEAVAKLVSPYSSDNCMVEIALCHDLIEDTNCTLQNLSDFLKSLKYSIEQIKRIYESVEELTDKYTSAQYPQLNRAERKTLEVKRMSYTNLYSQTVKYADLIDNTSTIVRYDAGFARVYLKEKFDLLNVMNRGHRTLQVMALDVYQAAIRELEKDTSNV